MIAIPQSVQEERSRICRKCNKRITVARLTDCHFDWIDCPYDCENDYEHYIREKVEEE